MIKTANSLGRVLPVVKTNHSATWEHSEYIGTRFLCLSFKGGQDPIHIYFLNQSKKKLTKVTNLLIQFGPSPPTNP